MKGEKRLIGMAWHKHNNDRAVVKNFLIHRRPDIVEDILYDWLDENEDKLVELGKLYESLPDEEEAGSD